MPSYSSTRLQLLLSTLLVLFFPLALPRAYGADEAASPSSPTLLLRNGDYVRGAREVSRDVQQIGWRVPAFAEPLVFPLANISGIQYPLPDMMPEAAGDFCFELAGGDTVSGQLTKLDERQLEIDSPRFGRIVMDRAQVFRFYRRAGHDLVYEGPQGLDGWRNLQPDASWREVRGNPATDKPRATLFRDVALPAQVLIDVELSWEIKPDFVLGLGVDSGPDSFRSAFRIECWRRDLVMLRETRTLADLVPLAKVAEGPGSIRLLLYLNQETGRLIACKATGELLGRLQVTDEAQHVYPGLLLENARGDVQLKRLRITRWSGAEPQAGGAASLTRADGSAVPGALRTFDPATGILTVQQENGTTTLPLAEVTQVMLAPPEAAEASPIQLAYLDGSQLSGSPLAWEAEHLVLRVRGCAEPVRAPLTDVRAVSVPGTSTAIDSSGRTGRVGTLRMDGVQLSGVLVARPSGEGNSCLVWRPAAAANAAQLRADADGRIVYREPPPKTPARTAATMRVQPAQNPGLFGGIARIFSGGSQASSPTLGPGLHLRTGDRIPCEVLKIDGDGVTIRSRYAEQTFVPHADIKALELIATPEPPRLTKAKRERLLTLPRMLRDAPPTHLVRSSNGDFVRGRIESMNDKELQFEVRLETKTVSRNRVTHIIWLHPDELAANTSQEAASSDRSADSDESPAAAAPPADEAAVPDEAASPDEAAEELLVQAQRADGIRLTFHPSSFAEETLNGSSKLLGDCHVKLTEIDQLLFGSEIRRAAATLPYHRWTLRPATAPKAALAAEGEAPEAPAAGTESALVNQPAPDFELPTLDGGTYKLSDQKGKIIVLDFWATWCGPCLQTMPQVEEVVAEFTDNDVELIGVNLEETPAQIQALLDRRPMSLRIVLDRDGAAAAKYAVTAIPQTVIIDRSGRIARLFVGGGPHFPAQLQTALRELAEGSEE